MAKRKPAPPVPASHLDLMRRCGFVALWWRNESVTVRDATGALVNEWLPGDLVNWEKRQFVRFNRAGEGSVKYSVDGYHPSEGPHHGGCCTTVATALGWFDFLARQLGRSSDA